MSRSSEKALDQPLHRDNAAEIALRILITPLVWIARAWTAMSQRIARRGRGAVHE